MSLLSYILVQWGSSDLLLDIVTAMVALLFDHLESVHEKTFKISPLSSSSFHSFSTSTAKKQAAGSSKEEKANKVPSMPVSKLPEITQHLHSMQNRSSASTTEKQAAGSSKEEKANKVPSMPVSKLPEITQRLHSMRNRSSASTTEAPSTQPYQHTQHHLPPHSLSAIARKHLITGPLASLSETMIGDSTQSSHAGRQMVFVARTKSSCSIVKQSLMSCMRTKKQLQKRLISASVDNPFTLASDNEKGQTRDCSELMSTLKLEAPPTANQSTTSQLTSNSEEVDHSIAGQQARPGSSSRQSPRIKFIRNTSHQQPQPITSTHSPQTSAGETSTLQPSSGTTAEHVDLSATGGQSGGIKFFADLDQISSQDHPCTHDSTLHSRGQGEEIKVDRCKRMPNQDPPTYRYPELTPHALKFTPSVATVEKSRALISQDFAGKPSTDGGSVVASEASCHEELASSSPAVVEYAGLGVPLFSQPGPTDAATGVSTHTHTHTHTRTRTHAHTHAHY